MASSPASANLVIRSLSWAFVARFFWVVGIAPPFSCRSPARYRVGSRDALDPIRQPVAAVPVHRRARRGLEPGVRAVLAEARRRRGIAVHHASGGVVTREVSQLARLRARRRGAGRIARAQSAEVALAREEEEAPGRSSGNI